jgi:uncharacterized membrane protein
VLTPQSLLRAFRSRPRLLEAIGVGAVSAIVLSRLQAAIATSTIAIAAWDIGCLFFIVAIFHLMRGQTADNLQQRCAAQDEGQGLILALVLLAATASIGAVAVELSAAKAAHGVEKALRIGAAFTTVALSWTMVQLIFALHYAAEYYKQKAEAPAGAYQGGLAFPPGDPPDFWDFLHFSVVIGVACQTADIGFLSKSLRRIGTVHGVIAFLFNTAVLALGINLVAGLF